MKNLYKSKDNRVLSGAIGGVGEYFEVDPVLLRVGWIILTVLTGLFPFAIAYFLMALIVPKKPATVV